MIDFAEESTDDGGELTDVEWLALVMATRLLNDKSRRFRVYRVNAHTNDREWLHTAGAL